MYKVVLQESAQKSLDKIFESDSVIFRKLLRSLEELENSGLKATSIKKLTNSESIFRKRVGRYRILFTVDDKRIDVWVVEMEKDSKKDYKRWLKYIKRYS